jgi:hypothetical protein
MKTNINESDIKLIAIDNFAKTEISVINLIYFIIIILIFVFVVWVILKKKR